MMKILDARDGLIKFKADSSICLSSFVKVLGQEKQYIAQVMQLRNVAQCSIAYAKLLFLHNGTLQQYDHTLPLRDSEIEDVTDDILTNSLIAESPIILGEFPNSKTPITVNSRIFNKKFLASVDDKSANQIIVQNLTKQFNNLNKKVVIIDMPGILDAKKITAGVDFKIPLDTYSLAFLYKECLSDATPESKSLIIEIFADLAEYSKTVPFVPFDVLKTIIDDMVEKSHVFKLLVLKNKLSKYDRLGYFAKTKKEVDVLDKILQKKCSVIDVSKLDPIFQNHYLSFIYRQLEKQQDSQIILETSNVITKKCLKNIFDCDNAPTMFITHSHFKFLNDIKNLFDNFLITPSLANNQAFKIYNNYLSQLQKNFYLLAGEAFNYIPIVSSLKNIDTLIPQQEKISDDNNSSPQDSDVNDSEIKDSNTENDDVTEENNVECVTEVNLAEESLSVSEEEKPTESTLSHEDLLSSIEEKSEAIIEEMSKDITPPDNMFSSADDSDENELELNSDEEDDNDNDSIFDEISKEPESQVSDVAEDVELEAITDDDNMGENIIESDDLSMTDISQEELFSTLNTEETIENYSSEELSEHDENDNISLDLNESNDITDSTEFDSESVVDELSLSTEELPTNDDVPSCQDDISRDDDSLNYQEEQIEQELEIPDSLDIPLNTEEELLSTDDLIPHDEPAIDVNIMPINAQEEVFDEIVELDPDDLSENDIIIDMTDDESGGAEDFEYLDEQIVKDVDKVFTTRKDDDISDSDLDFIDQMNSGDEEFLTENLDSNSKTGVAAKPINEIHDTLENENNNDNNEILETKNTSTPIVPVYDAEIPQEDIVISDQIEQGDTVIHAKYGNGVVEKMIKYGNKTLYSINFDNIGRRLLDPSLTEIKLART